MIFILSTIETVWNSPKQVQLEVAATYISLRKRSDRRLENAAAFHCSVNQTYGNVPRGGEEKQMIHKVSGILQSITWKVTIAAHRGGTKRRLLRSRVTIFEGHTSRYFYLSLDSLCIG
jgi:hypothetical protein